VPSGATAATSSPSPGRSIAWWLAAGVADEVEAGHGRGGRVGVEEAPHLRLESGRGPQRLHGTTPASKIRWAP